MTDMLAARAGLDTVDGAGVSGSSDVFVNGFGFIRAGDAVGEHNDDDPSGESGAPSIVPGISSNSNDLEGVHAGQQIASGCANVFVNGMNASRINDYATCGHHIAAGSGTDVYISGDSVKVLSINDELQ